MDFEGDSAAEAGQPSSRTAKTYLVPAVLCMAFVVLADRFFYRQPLGWTLGCYGLLLLAAIVIRAGRPLRRGPALLVVAASALLLLWCFEEPGLLTVLLGLLGLASVTLIAGDGWTASALVWFRRWASFLMAGWLYLAGEALACRQARQAQDQPRALARVFRLWFLPIGLGLVFLAFFASANPIISDWLVRAWQFLTDLIARIPSFGRILMWVLVGVWVWALLRFRSGIGLPSQSAAPASAPISDALFSPGLVVRCLLLFNALFAVQTALDLFYLWGGAKLPEGMTYAQYAHRGAYPLLATALLAALFVLVTFRHGSRTNGMATARGLVYLWIAQNLLLVISAGWRLCLYIEVFSLTRWRIAAAIWMFLVVCGLVWILTRIVARRTNLWLVNVNAVTALVVLFAVSFVDSDGLIASFNVRHCEEIHGSGRPIDLAYLEGLGPETLPALVWLSGQLKDSSRASEVHGTIARLSQELDDDLRNWRGWTFRRARLAQLELPVESLQPQVHPAQNRERQGRRAL